MPTKVEPTTLELLEKALAVLRERGMAKGELEDDAGHVCARGALMMAGLDVDGPLPIHHGWLWLETAGGRRVDDTLRLALGRLHPLFDAYDSDKIVEFNNADETTQEDVEALFEEAIRWERERAG